MHIVRRAKPEDALGIHEAHMRSIREVCANDYSEDAIRGWGNRPYREDHRVNAINNQYVWVVDNDGKIEGFGHFMVIPDNGRNRGHLMGLYLAPEANGKGLGGIIVREMLVEARKQSVFEINLESSLTAHSFYQKMGFKDSGVQAEMDVNGSKVAYIPMKMVLT
jgi:putative acetyltransferase